MALAAALAPTPLGQASPRLAPPIPAKTDLDGFRKTAKGLGISLMPWQETAARYLEAQAADDRHLYREVAVVVGRQNGKTTELVPLIVKRLRKGRRMMHTAQNRELPREVFGLVADALAEHDAKLFPRRKGRVIGPRFANGQEEIRLTNGGRYRIVAPTRGGARGPTNDDVLVDEVRELDDHEFIAAAKPTMTASPDPQIVYLSNAGDDSSIVLNALRDRAGADPRLAYLEWSADPSRAPDDQLGWAEANPAIGHIPTMLEYLGGEYLSNKLAGTLPIFETEHLCRWVNSVRQPLVNLAAWNAREVPALAAVHRPMMAVSMEPDGRRACAAVAWRQPDEKIALRLIYDVPGHPIDTDRLGRDLRDEGRKLAVRMVGFDPITDAQLARFFVRKQPITAQKYANASARFVTLIESEQLVWADAAGVGDDLTWTARKSIDESGAYQAVRSSDERPITAVRAAIRAVWLASEPLPSATVERRGAVGF